MKIGDRIRALREELDLTQAQFAEKIGLKATAIGLYESGDRRVTDRSIMLIAQVYGISEEWLRGGIGSKYVVDADDEISLLSQKYNLSNRARIILETFLKMDDAQRKVLEDYIQAVSLQFLRLDQKVVPFAAMGGGGVVSEEEARRDLYVTEEDDDLED